MVGQPENLSFKDAIIVVQLLCILSKRPFSCRKLISRQHLSKTPRLTCWLLRLDQRDCADLLYQLINPDQFDQQCNVQKTVKPLKMILHLLQITCSSSTQLATMFPARSHRKVLILGGNLLESRNLLVFISQMIASFQIYSVTPRNYDFSDQMKSHVSGSPSFW